MSVQLRSKRGAIGTAWHAVALRETVENHLGAARATAGKRLARGGRVEWFDVAPGQARAGVLGDDGQIAQASLEFLALRAGDRDVMLQILRAHPELPARLASGAYPESIEAELAGEELHLLPSSARSEITHSCTCLDWPGPCVHVAALAYVLVEAVEEHPQHLLALRSLTLADVAAPVGRASAGAGSGGDDAPVGTSSADAAPSPDASDGDASGGAAESPHQGQGGFDPAIADPTVLHELLGQDAGAVLAAFYRAGQGGRAEHTEAERDGRGQAEAEQAGAEREDS